MNCYLCGTDLESLDERQRTNEHIIPDALGGNITSRSLLCRNCNNRLASQIDNALVEQLRPLSELLVQAGPGSIAPDATTHARLEDGTPVRLIGALHPEIPIEIQMPGLPPIRFTALRSEIDKKVRKKLAQLKGRFLDLDIENAMSSLEIKDYPDRLIYFSNSPDPKQGMVGGPPFFRAIKRIAVNFYLHAGGDPAYIQAVIHQVKTGELAPSCISKFYYPSIRPVHVPANQEISHIIKLVGDPDMGVLYCYIELFNTNASLILLNDSYDGPTINQQYHYDLISRQFLTEPINLPIKHRGHVTDHFVVDRDTNPQGNATYQRTRRVLEEMIKQRGGFV